MDIAPTPENRALSSAVNARLRSDARILNAKAAFWRMVGGGVLCALIGAGIGAAFYGYSYARDPAPTAQRTAQAFAEALDRVTLKLDPNLKVASAAEPPQPVPRPSAAQLGTDTPAPSQAAVATAFTVFKNVPFAAGQVVTGWNLQSSDQASPSHQYCYYSEQLDGTSKVTVDLGENGRALPQAKARANVDPATAYRSCVWFKAGAL
jgi:hypothetical protein